MIVNLGGGEFSLSDFSPILSTDILAVDWGNLQVLVDKVDMVSLDGDAGK